MHCGSHIERPSLRRHKRGVENRESRETPDLRESHFPGIDSPLVHSGLRGVMLSHLHGKPEANACATYVEEGGR